MIILFIDKHMRWHPCASKLLAFLKNKYYVQFQSDQRSLRRRMRSKIGHVRQIVLEIFYILTPEDSKPAALAARDKNTSCLNANDFCRR